LRNKVIMIELLFRIIFEIIVRDFFGYYTLYFVYFIVGNKEGLELLKKEETDDNFDAFSTGCLQTIAGWGSIMLLVYILSLL